MDTTELARIVLKEVSAVDSPANQLDGWMVRKNAALASLPTRQLEAAEAITELAKRKLAEHNRIAGVEFARGTKIKKMSAEQAVEHVVALVETARKARHSARHESSGRFVSQAQATVHSARKGLMPWTHGGNVHPSLMSDASYGPDVAS